MRNIYSDVIQKLRQALEEELEEAKKLAEKEKPMGKGKGEEGSPPSQGSPRPPKE